MLKNPGIGTLGTDEPILRYVDLSTTHIAAAQELTLPPWARTVIPGPKGAPLLYAGVRAGVPTAVLAFEPRESDLPLQVAFPILIANLTGELLGGSAAPLAAVTPGDPVSLTIPAGASGLHVVRPDGSAVDLVPGAAAGSTVTFTATDQLGVYTATPIVSPDGSAGPAESAGAGASSAAGPRSPSPAASGALRTPTARTCPGGSPSRSTCSTSANPRSRQARSRCSRISGARSPGRPVRPLPAPVRRGRATRRPRRDLDPDRHGRARPALCRVDRLPPGRRPARPAGDRRAARPRAAGAERLMGIGVDAPLALLLLIPALAITIGLHLASRRRLGAGRRRVALAVRSVLLVAIVLALAGFRLVLPVDRLATVYVVDLSDSVGQPGREDALAWLRESLTAMPEGDVAGIVGFGRAALVERLPQEVREIDRIASTPVRSATDIGAALRLASALFPDDAQKRIVLLSDGNDTTGTGQSEAALAAARGSRSKRGRSGSGPPTRSSSTA